MVHLCLVVDQLKDPLPQFSFPPASLGAASGSPFFPSPAPVSAPYNTVRIVDPVPLRLFSPLGAPLDRIMPPWSFLFFLETRAFGPHPLDANDVLPVL